MHTSDISSSEPEDPDKYIWSGSSYSSSWYSDSETDCNLLSTQFLSDGWTTGIGGVNGGPAADDVDCCCCCDGGGGGGTAATAVVAFPPPFDMVAEDICSMTTFIRLLLEGRRSSFFFNLPIFAHAVQQWRQHANPGGAAKGTLRQRRRKNTTRHRIISKLQPFVTRRKRQRWRRRRRAILR